MLKIRKGNVIYKIEKEHVDGFLRQGFEIVEILAHERETHKSEAQIIRGRTLMQLRKDDLKDLAWVRNIELNGDETINELRNILR